MKIFLTVEWGETVPDLLIPCQEVPRGAQQGQHSQKLIGAITKNSSRL